MLTRALLLLVALAPRFGEAGHRTVRRAQTLRRSTPRRGPNSVNRRFLCLAQTVRRRRDFSSGLACDACAGRQSSFACGDRTVLVFLFPSSC